jgi:hypothetical protein
MAKRDQVLRIIAQLDGHFRVAGGDDRLLWTRCDPGEQGRGRHHHG